MTIMAFDHRDKKNVYWLVKCRCGREVVVPWGNLRRNTSCGCHRKRSGASSHSWKGCGEMPASYLCKLKTHAKRRKIEVGITVEYLWELWQQQEGHCSLSGTKLTYPQSFRALSSGEGNASLDRINYSEGYIVGNVQWVDKDINFMKQQLSQECFISLCVKVADHNKRKDE